MSIQIAVDLSLIYGSWLLVYTVKHKIRPESLGFVCVH